MTRALQLRFNFAHPAGMFLTDFGGEDYNFRAT
jgi:hypothetical protein